MLEAPLLTDHVQLTSRDRFVKAGEAYFDASASWIIFQAVPVPAGDAKPDDFYSMYVAKLVRGEDGRISGLEEPILISPPGSWNSCGWFHPKLPGAVLFSSTLTPPAKDQKFEFQVRDRKYVWLFPEEAEIVVGQVPEVFADIVGKPAPEGATTQLEKLFPMPDYQAEGSWSKDGRFVLYASVKPERVKGRADADIFVYDARTAKHHTLVTADGYDGGPFFSPDETMICYRSDRKFDDRLQIFVAELKYEDGVPVGIVKEHQLTDNGLVNWAPYWHPSGEYLVFGTSLEEHRNYEIAAVEVKPGVPARDLPSVRVTHASGADVLPVFSRDGRWMMWTAQRGALAEGEQRPSSQLWVARVSDHLNFVAMTWEAIERTVRSRLAELGWQDFVLKDVRTPGGWFVTATRVHALEGAARIIEFRFGNDGKIRTEVPGPSDHPPDRR